MLVLPSLLFFFDSPVRSSDKDRMAYPSPTFKHGIGVVKTKKKGKENRCWLIS
jgi:hypothetical protein